VVSGNPLSALASLTLLLMSPPPAADTAAISAAKARLGVTDRGALVDPDRSALPASLVAEERLRREHSLSIARALERWPGLHTLSTGGQIGKPVLRGIAGPRVLVLDDGYRVEDYSWSDEDGPSIDARLADHVEVIRGPASVLYGSDALGGVVNAVPAEIPDARGHDPFTRTGIEAYGASNNAEFGGALRLEHARGAFGGRLMITGRDGGDLHTPDGGIPNTGFNSINGEAALGFRAAGGNATLRYARYGGEFELLEAGPPPPEASRRRLDDHRVQIGGDFMLGGLRFESRAQWQLHSLIDVAGSPEGEQIHLDLNTYTLDLLTHHGAGAVRGTLGLSGLAQTNDTRGPIPVVPDTRMHSGAAFALERLDVGRFGFLAGGRVDWRHLETESNASLGLPDQARDDQEASANGGILYRVSDALTLAANAGGGWRAPSLFELYANGPHLGEPRYELGDPDLEPERSLEADAGIRVRQSRVRLDLTGFVNRIDRYIYPAATGDTRVVGTETLPVYEYTQADARLAGGELWAEFDATAPVTLRALGDYVRGENLDLDQPLPQVPPLRGVFEAELHGANLGWAERAAVGIGIEHVSEQTRLAPLDTAADSYTLLHLDAGMTRRFAGRSVQIDLGVRNLADRTYRSFLSRYKAFAADPGRNVVLRLSTEL
jgi:iron complex outermembrane recepter protein